MSPGINRCPPLIWLKLEVCFDTSSRRRPPSPYLATRRPLGFRLTDTFGFSSGILLFRQLLVRDRLKAAFVNHVRLSHGFTKLLHNRLIPRLPAFCETLSLAFGKTSAQESV